MAQLQLNKSSLSNQKTKLKTYQRFLPSLDLKRQQLMVEKAKAQTELDIYLVTVRDLTKRVGTDLPMLDNPEVDLTGIVRLKDYQLTSENIVGTKLPVLTRINIEMKPYSTMAKPHWVDDVARLLQQMLETRLHVQIAKKRVKLLDQAAKTISQRASLFEKILIPTTRDNIKKIKISLSDAQMSAVVRSKIAKRKRAST